jgi:hypothetical protein
MGKKKKGFDVEGGVEVNQDYTAAQLKAKYGIDIGDLNITPYVTGSTFKPNKGKPMSSIDRLGADAEYKINKNASLRGGFSTDPQGIDKRAGVEARYSFKKGGAVKKKTVNKTKISSASKRADGCITKGKTKGKMV